MSVIEQIQAEKACTLNTAFSRPGDPLGASFMLREHEMSAIAGTADCSGPDAGPAAAVLHPGQQGTEVLVFEVASQRYALPTRDVRELVRAVAITLLPDAPAVIEGVVNVRGCVLPVLDVRARFGLPARALDPSDHFIVASAGKRGVILRVDRATHIAFVDEASVHPPESLGAIGGYVAGVAKLEGGLVLIHDVATFLSAAENASLDGALATVAAVSHD